AYLENKLIKLQREWHSLRETLNVVLASMKKQLRKREVHLVIDPELPMFSYDEALIKEVFINLIDNAIKYTPSKTPIDITLNFEKDKLIVDIEDYGPGLIPDEVDKLFEKFYRGKQLTTQRGMGLGL